MNNMNYVAFLFDNRHYTPGMAETFVKTNGLKKLNMKINEKHIVITVGRKDASKRYKVKKINGHIKAVYC